MSNLVLKANPRETHYSKGELNKYRAKGSIPACIFGKGIESIPVFVDSMSFSKAYRTGGKIFELDISGKKHLINVQAVDKDALGKTIMHISFHKLSANEKVKIEVPLTWSGNAIGVKNGGLVQVIESNIPVSGRPGDIPESIEYDLSELDLNGNVHWSDIKLPKGLEADFNDDKVCVVCKLAKVEVEEPTEVTELAADAAETSDTAAPTGEESEEVKKAS